MPTRITFNGQEYAGVEAMPAAPPAGTIIAMPQSSVIRNGRPLGGAGTSVRHRRVESGVPMDAVLAFAAGFVLTFIGWNGSGLMLVAPVFGRAWHLP